MIRRIVLAVLLCIGLHTMAQAACSGGYVNAVNGLGATVKGFWCLNETGTITNGNITDYSGNADTGTYGSANVAPASSLVTDGSGNGAVAFTAAVNSTATLGSIPNTANIALANFTATFWYKSGNLTGATNNPRLLAMGAVNANEAGWNVALNPPTGPQGLMQVSNGTTGNNPCNQWANIADGSTHLIAVGVTGTTAFCSMDAGTYTTATSINYAAGSLNLIIGNSPGTSTSNSAPGTYQYIAIFQGQLSQANLTTLYNCGHSGSCGATPVGLVIIGQ